MDRLSKIAKANYKAGSDSSRTSADEFFKAMKKNKYGLVDFADFQNFMRSKGHDYYAKQKLFDSLDEKRALGFWQVITLYYIINSRRPFCGKCDHLVTSVYFACKKCYESSRGPYCICLSCYEHTDKPFTHPKLKCDGDRPHFLDNFTLLENRRRLAVQRKADQLRKARAKDDFDLNGRPARRQTPTKLRRSQSVGRK